MLITSHRCTTPVWQTPGSATPLAIATTRPLEWMLLPGNRRVMTKSKVTGVGPEAKGNSMGKPTFCDNCMVFSGHAKLPGANLHS